MEGITNAAQIIQIIANVFVMLAGVIAIWQYSYDKKKQRHFRDKERVQRAIDIAIFYKENVLTNSRGMKDKLFELGTLDIVESIDMNKIEHFDIHEIETVYNQEQLKRIRIIREQYGIDSEVEKKSVSYRPSKGNASMRDEVAVTTDNPKEEAGKDYVKLMIQILNDLEIFAMHFVHETADETVVYQPLHMSYLEIVRMLYYDIAYANRNGARKYYINTIILFNKWKKRSEEKKKKEISGIRSMAETGKVLETGKISRKSNRKKD